MLDFKDHSKVSKCPSKFPNHDMSFLNTIKGDICRDENMLVGGVYDVDWNCPVGCVAVPDAMPYCKMSPSDNAPCRINSKFFHFL